MANYFARVELHDAPWPIGYERLHTEMAKHNFANCVPTSDAGRLRLPTAFYYADGRLDDITIVANAVKACADSTGYKNEVTVVKSAGSINFLSKKCDGTPNN